MEKTATPLLLSVPEVAAQLRVSHERVKEWARRAEDPLPNVLVGWKHKIIAAEIGPWLVRENERRRLAALR